MTPETHPHLDAYARARLGRPLDACGADELGALARMKGDDAARVRAEADQARAALAEARGCGCWLEAPRLPDGGPDVGRAWVDHTCGKEETT
jgi:hypothetical protein